MTKYSDLRFFKDNNGIYCQASNLKEAMGILTRYHQEENDAWMRAAEEDTSGNMKAICYERLRYVTGVEWVFTGYVYEDAPPKDLSWPVEFE
jgi:hypothetical protein